MRMARTKTELDGALEAPTDMFLKKFHNQQVKVAVKAAEKCKEWKNYDLTDKEKFAVAFCAGVKMDVEQDPKYPDDHTKIVFKTEQVDVAWVGDEFIVAKRGK